MTLSHLQGHSYCNHFKYDFYPCDAKLVGICYYREFVCSLSVCSSQVGVLLRRLYVEFQKESEKIVQGLLVLRCKRSLRNSDGNIPKEGAKSKCGR